MLGSWYTPREIGKRAMVFWLAGSIGQMFSGFLQAAAVSSSKFQSSFSCEPSVYLLPASHSLSESYTSSCSSSVTRQFHSSFARTEYVEYPAADI